MGKSWNRCSPSEADLCEAGCFRFMDGFDVVDVITRLAVITLRMSEQHFLLPLSSVVASVLQEFSAV